MNPIYAWLTKFLATKIAHSIVESLNSKGVLDKCRSVTEEWNKRLPDGEELVCVDPLFQTLSEFSNDSLASGPKRVLSCLNEGNIPPASAWHDDLFDQWQWVSEQIVEPAPFFCIDKEKAKNHLKTLAEQLHQECAKDHSLFQIDTHKKLTENTDITKKTYVETKAMSSGIDCLTSLVDSLSNTQSANKATEKINEATELTTNGYPGLAQTALEEIKRKHWGDLAPYDRYRLVANLGIAKIEQGLFEEGARDFLECVQYAPNDEKPRCWQANGLLLLGERQECEDKVTSILEDFPESSFAYALKVFSASKDDSFTYVENLVPSRMRRDAEIANALFRKAFSSNRFEEAEKYARICCSGDNIHPKNNQNLACVIIESTLRYARSYLSDKPPVDESRLLEAVKLLDDAALNFNKREDYKSKAACHFYLGRAYFFLDDSESSEKEFMNAYDLDENDPNYSSQYALALYVSKKDVKALSILEATASKDTSLNSATLAVNILNDRSEGHECSHAISILESAQIHFPGPSEPTNIEYITRLINEHVNNSMETETLTALSENLYEQLNSESKGIAKAFTLRRCGKKAEAIAEIQRTKESINDDTDIWLKLLVAKELKSCGLIREAFELLKSFISDKVESTGTGLLIHSAQLCEEDGFLLDFLRELRASGVLHPFYIELEVSLLEQYHAGDKSAAIIEKLLQCSYGDDDFQAALRVRRSVIGVNYNNPDLVETDLDVLPRADSASPQIGSAVVFLLIERDQFDQARDYAYILLRCHPNSVEVNRAYIGSYLFEKNASKPKDPIEVLPSTAIQYVEEGDDRIQIAIIEDGPNPNADRCEYPPDHHVFASVIGKRVDDTFSLSNSPLQLKKGCIKRIYDKKIYRFNACLESYDKKFGDGFLVRSSINRDSEGEPDFEPIRLAIEERKKAVEIRDDLYRSHPLSIASYAVMSDASALDVIGHLAQSELPIRCCEGSLEEEREALKFLDSANELVLGPTMLATQVHIGGGKLLRKLPFNLIVPRSAILSIRSAIEDSVRFTGGGAMGTSGSKLIFTKTDPNQVEKWISALKDIVTTLEDIGTIVDGTPLAHASPDNRKEIIKLFGQATAEAIVIAQDRKVPLWTDDGIVTLIANCKYNTNRVWSEVVWQWTTSNDHITKDVRRDLVSRLVELGYCHTKLYPSAAVHMGAISEWDFRCSPLKSAIRWIEVTDVSSEAIREIVESLLPEIISNHKGITHDASIQTVLSAIGKRREGLQIIYELRGRVGHYCQNRTYIETELYTAIDLWLELTGKKKIL